MVLKDSSRTRKRKIIGNDQEEEESEKFSPEFLQSLAQAEANDLEDLTLIASEATVIEFDNLTGRPLQRTRPSSSCLSASSNGSDCGYDESPIDGLVKLSNALLLANDPDLFRDLAQIHSIVKHKVRFSDMVPWAGIGGDTTRLRAFGFLGKESLTRLDSSSAVRLHAPEKQGDEALRDERANRRAICVLHKTRERVLSEEKDDPKVSDNKNMPTAPRIVNPTLVADKLCNAILDNRSGDNFYLNSKVFCSKELIAYQTNLHNGAKHLAAHLDAPLHEGFGKVIVTVAIRGSATILLIGKGDDDDDDDEEYADEEDVNNDQQLQPAWKFHLKEGEVYVLSGNVRNVCLHAVLANGGDSGGDRESLNLRFGIHSIKEAEENIKRHWPDLW
jgi:hypothetical protein